MPKPVSLDQILSERAMTVRNTDKGEALIKVYKSPASWDAEKRSARFVMTAEVTDRYGDIVVAKGGDVSEFEKNPVALWCHDNRSFPVGGWQNLALINGTKKRWEGDCVLNAEGLEPNTDILAGLIAAGTVRACSIGFMPKAWESIKDEKDRWTGYKFLEWELLECSPCNVPANPAALIKAAGGDTRSALQAIELVLDEWARTPEGLIVPRKDFELAYTFTKDATKTVHEVRALEEDVAEAPEPTLTNLDIEAAVSRGIEKVADGVVAKIAALFGKTVSKPKDEEPCDPEGEDPEDPEDEEEKTAGAEEGETDEEFQARVKAKEPELELADEAEELALRSRVAEVA